MNLTLSVLLQSGLATLACLVLFVPVGYSVGRLAKVADFPKLHPPEKLLWSVVLSIPLSLFVTNIPGRYCNFRVLSLITASLSLASLCLLFVDTRANSKSSAKLDRHTRVILLVLVGLVLYIWFAGVPLALPHRLYEPVFSGDWEVRLPLIRAVMQGGIPPHSPFFTFKGKSPPLHYYFYLYSVCGLVAHLAHVSARAALLGSSVHAALGILAILFLYQKYLVEADTSLRERCALLLLVCCVLGLDVVPSTLRLFFWPVHLLPEIEWWSQDRSPGLLAALLYAPHHIQGAVCGLAAFLLLALLMQHRRSTKRTLVTHAILVGLCFAALVGTSTFICLFFALACTVLCIYAASQKRTSPALALLAAGVISVSVSIPYLHDLLRALPASGTQVQPHHLLVPQLRDLDFAHSLTAKWSLVRHKPEPTGFRKYSIRIILVLALYLCETGFFLIVIVAQFRRDFRSAHRPSLEAKSLWLLAGTLGIFFLFLSSKEIQQVNDLGLQAGLVLRFVFITWGARLVASHLQKRRSSQVLTSDHWFVHLATTCFALGLIMTLWQAVIERTYVILQDNHIVPAYNPFPNAYHIGAVYLDIYQAQQAAAHLLPARAVVQSDPAGRYQTIFRLYQERRQAAGDVSCEGAFGGDPQLCQSFTPALLRIFGSHAPLPDKRMHTPAANPTDMTLDAMSAVCHQDGIAALAASRADPAWYDRNSWVWQGTLLYANTTVRLIGCPLP